MDRDPFFTTVSSKRAKRWGADRQTSRSKKNLKPRPGKGHNQDEMDSDNDIGSLLEDETMNRLFNNDDEPDKDDTVVEESASEKRLRMAKEIIQQIEEEEREREIEGDMLTDAVSHRLREEVDRQKGVLRRLLAQKLQGKVPSSKLTVTLKGHRLPVTSAVISADTRYVVTGSKDGVIIKWLRQGIRLHTWKRKSKANPKGHNGKVLSIALNSNNTYLASAGSDKIINIWDFETHQHLKSLLGHRKSVNSICFRLGENTLFSASDDRTIKVWNIDALSYVETLYGHQDQIIALDSLHQERALSCGGRDRTVRLWKIVESSQLVYVSPGTSVDCLAMITELHFITGNENGSLSLWDINKRKPTFTVAKAHGVGHWISSVAAVPYSDLAASGSSNGFVHLWDLGERNTKLKLVMKFPMVGWINSLKFTADGYYLVAGVGKEPRFGRWSSLSNGNNATFILSLSPTTLEDETSEKSLTKPQTRQPTQRLRNKTKLSKSASKINTPNGFKFASSVLQSTSLSKELNLTDDDSEMIIPTVGFPDQTVQNISRKTSNKTMPKQNQRKSQSRSISNKADNMHSTGFSSNNSGEGCDNSEEIVDLNKKTQEKPKKNNDNSSEDIFNRNKNGAKEAASYDGGGGDGDGDGVDGSTGNDFDAPKALQTSVVSEIVHANQARIEVKKNSTNLREQPTPVRRSSRLKNQQR